MKSAIVEGKRVTIGDYVSFKSDVEQSGEIIDIKNGYYGKELLLGNDNGFQGHYIGGDITTTVAVRDCWVEG